MPATHPIAGAPLKVGIVGAGPVAQSVHLPVLANLPEQFTIAHVMDISAETAREVARRSGARSSTSLDELLADDAVDVVAICSPHHLHAEQVIACFRAGKKGVLCEKPLAVSREQAEEIAAASTQYGVPLVVGSMHKYDTGWTRGVEAWQGLGRAPRSIRSSIVLPPNSRFEDFAVEPLGPGPTIPPRGDTREERAGSVSRGLLGLAVHDLPLIRQLAASGATPVVRWAEAMRPMGYRVVFTLGDVVVDLMARIHPTWRPNWSLEAFADDASLRIDFTPSYVLAGSATAELRVDGAPTTQFASQQHNGYEGEWQHLAAVVSGERPIEPSSELIDDLDLTLRLSQGAGDWILSDGVLGDGSLGDSAKVAS